MFVFSNLATSLDGKIATKSRELFHLGTPADRKQMQVLRKRADVVVMGGSTLRTFKRFCGVQGRKKQPANAILSTNLQGISPDWPFFQSLEQQRILLITQPLSPARLKAFAQTSEIVLLKKPSASRPLASQILEALQKRGLAQVLVEGGGGLMWTFASENLIDEYHLTLTPRIIGGTGAPSLVEGSGFNPSEVLNLKLARCRRLGDELYLTYRKTNKRG
jgi:riboflavin-specific deaminase-like protein